MLVTEQVIGDRTAKQGMDDERPSHRQTSWVVGSRMNDIFLCRFHGFGEKESECPGRQALTK